MDAYFERRAREIFASIRYATIATSNSQGEPWNTPVSSAHDSAASIYWVSDRRNQHSRNIRQNPNVFMVFYDSTVPAGKGEGVYLAATAVELSDIDEIQQARDIIGEADAPSSEQFAGYSILRLYKAVPSEAWMNAVEISDGVFIRDYRVEIPLAALCGG
jgi:hypothetical protein